MVFEIIRDHPGIDHRLLAMEQHRHPLGAVRRDRVLFGEAPRDRSVVELLMRQRHPRPPAKRAERTRGVVAYEFVELE
jgi:hypothetical protein